MKTMHVQALHLAEGAAATGSLNLVVEQPWRGGLRRLGYGGGAAGVTALGAGAGVVSYRNAAAWLGQSRVMLITAGQEGPQKRHGNVP